MIYNNIRKEIQGNNIIARKSIESLVTKKINGFNDVISLYIDVASMLVNKGVLTLDVKEPKKKDGKNVVVTRDFDKEAFDALILRKGSLIINEHIMFAVVKDCTVFIEEYLQQFLLGVSPKYSYFADFQKGNFSGVKYVFNSSSMDSVARISYNNAKGDLVVYNHVREYTTLKREEIQDIVDNVIDDANLKETLKLISEKSFTKWRKYVIQIAEILYRKDDVYNNGELLESLDTEINLIKEEEKRTKKEKGKSKSEEALEKDVVESNKSCPF